MSATPSPRVLSGIQASGALHLGNYLGALKRFTALQDEAPAFLFVADLHAITQWQDLQASRRPDARDRRRLYRRPAWTPSAR